MKNGIWIVAALFLGALFGACFRGAVRESVVGEAHAQPGAHRYKVVGASTGPSGYEEDLNKMSVEGWRYVGAIPMGQYNAPLVFERP